MRTLTTQETKAVNGAGLSQTTAFFNEVGGAVLRPVARIGDVLLKGLGATLGWFSRELG